MSKLQASGGTRRRSSIARVFLPLVFVIGGLLFALQPGVSVQAAEQKAAVAFQVNINAATPEQLEALPGVGSARAQAIVKLRHERGQFKSIEELLDVKGIGQSGLAKMAPHVVLEGKTRLP